MIPRDVQVQLLTAFATRRRELLDAEVRIAFDPSLVARALRGDFGQLAPNGQLHHGDGLVLSWDQHQEHADFTLSWRVFEDPLTNTPSVVHVVVTAPIPRRTAALDDRQADLLGMLAEAGIDDGPGSRARAEASRAARTLPSHRGINAPPPLTSSGLQDPTRLLIPRIEWTCPHCSETLVAESPAELTRLRSPHETWNRMCPPACRSAGRAMEQARAALRDDADVAFRSTRTPGAPVSPVDEAATARLRASLDRAGVRKPPTTRPKERFELLELDDPTPKPAESASADPFAERAKLLEIEE